MRDKVDQFGNNILLFLGYLGVILISRWFVYNQIIKWD
jgi:hypothetical protein